MMTAGEPKQLLAEVRRVRDHVREEGRQIFGRWEPMLRRGAFRDSATNLAHYLALREVDLRPLQKSLVAWGLTGLGRSESRVMPTLDAAMANLEMLCGDPDNGIVRPSVEAFWPEPKH